MGIADGGEVNSLTTREPVVDIFLIAGNWITAMAGREMIYHCCC